MKAPTDDLFPTGEQSPAMIQPEPSSIGLFSRLQTCWQPQPLDRPHVDPELPLLPAPQRCAEVIRFSLTRAEYWLSPGGTLREWLRLHLWLALMLGIPVALLAPVLTAWLTTFTGWSALLAEISRNLLFIPAGLFASVFLFVLTVLLLRILLPRR